MKKISGIKAPALFSQQPASGGGAHVSGDNSHVSGGGSGAKSDFVQIMQEMMGELSEKIIQNSKEIFEVLPNGNEYKDVGSMEKDAKGFGNTAIGFSGASAADGLWGGNTKKALDNINTFISKAKLNAQALKSSPTMGQADSKVIDENAKDNIADLKQIFSSLKLGSSSYGGGRYGTEVWDHIDPKNLTLETENNPFAYGNTPVIQNSLSSLLSFFEFSRIGFGPLQPCILLQNKPNQTPKKKSSFEQSNVAKIAKQILDSNIITLSQVQNPWEASQAVNPAPQKQDSYLGNTSYNKLENAGKVKDNFKNTEPMEEKGENVGETIQDEKISYDRDLKNGLCINQIEDILAWFGNRARSRMGKISDAFQYNDVLLLDGNDKPQRRPNDKDMKNAQDYYKAVENLYREFESIKGNITKNILAAHPGQNAVPGIVTPEMLTISGASHSPFGHGASGHGGVNYGTHGQDQGVDRSYGNEANGPLSGHMDLQDLATYGADDSGFVDKLKNEWGKITIIDLQDFQRRGWEWIANTYSNNQPTPETGAQDVCANIRKIIEKAFQNYQDSGQGSSSSQRDQYNWFSEWSTVLTRTQRVANNAFHSNYGKK